MTAQEFAHAIAIVESSDRSNPPLGDDGRALGRYQMHPTEQGDDVYFVHRSSIWRNKIAALDVFAQLPTNKKRIETYRRPSTSEMASRSCLGVANEGHNTRV